MTETSAEVKPFPFTYPSQHIRRHGPTGYKNYDAYRSWLRDEFSFRCVFCLGREQWSVTANNWHIDHYISQSRAPLRALEYDNLLYVCSTCNSFKSSHLVPDPSVVSFNQCLRVNQDGTITALNDDGQLLIDTLRLNSEKRTAFRSLIIETLRVLILQKKSLFTLWMRYPEDLPDLRALHAPNNTRPSGVIDSFFEQRARGVLEEIYE